MASVSGSNMAAPAQIPAEELEELREAFAKIGERTKIWIVLVLLLSPCP